MIIKIMRKQTEGNYALAKTSCSIALIVSVAFSNVIFVRKERASVSQPSLIGMMTLFASNKFTGELLQVGLPVGMGPESISKR